MPKIPIVQNIEAMSLSELAPFDKNPKQHPPDQVEKIKKSIEAFGFNVPILISAERGIVAGHGRYEASKQLIKSGRLDKVPVTRLEHLDPVQLKAFLIADNKTAESPWDEAVLADLLNDISEENADYDLTLTGFDLADVEDLLNEMTVDRTTEPEKSSSGTVRVSGKNIVIGINSCLVISTDEGTNNRIKEFCDFIENNPPLKERADKIVIQKTLEAINEILPA